jgi:predicted alpha-1,2-mannosidase
MKYKKLPIYLTLLGTISCAQVDAYLPNSDLSTQYIDYVNPFIGTDGKGKTYPGATVPYGMVQLSPDNGRNGWDWISGYFYPDNIISGFSHTHLSGTGAGDLYDISFMPISSTPISKKLDNIKATETVYSTFSHENEKASPGYYQVYLESYDINVQLTAGLRTGIQRYTYSERQGEGIVKLDLGYSRNWDKTVSTKIEIVDEFTIKGYRKSTGWAKDQRVYFYTKFSSPIKNYEVNLNGKRLANKQSTFEEKNGLGLETKLFFDTSTNKNVEIKTAISSVSAENAKMNLIQDGINKKFEEHLQLAQQKWNDKLSVVDVDASLDNKIQFYTALYHSYLAPRVFSDANGQYKGPDGNTHRAEGFKRYSFFSLWDTFRALHPWKTITDSVESQDMMDSIYAHYKEYGLLPVWNFQGNETDMMMGYHAVPVLVDAYLKGITRIDGEELLEAMKKSAMQNDFSIDQYKKLGYVPYESGNWNVSLTLEYAFDDWSIAQMALALDKIHDHKYFLDRSKNYTNHFDSSINFMRPKSINGSFKEKFDPLAYHPEDFCEANAWQYNFFVPHDVDNLVKLMGGYSKFEEKLDQMFLTSQSSKELPEWISGYIGQYVHGNEPAHHVPYLYQYIGKGHKTQARVRQIMDELYTTTPDGLVGNEDAGQMSAWYMFSAIGFYPVNPVSGEYVLGSPEVNSATLNLPNGKKFTVKVNNQSPDNVFVQSILLNGKEHNKFTINHTDIMSGGELTFNMAAQPK